MVTARMISGPTVASTDPIYFISTGLAAPAIAFLSFVSSSGFNPKNKHGKLATFSRE